MAKRKRLLPFWLMPGSWGLKGPVYDQAKAYYLYDGEDLERRLVEIQCGDDQDALTRANLNLDVRYGRLTPYERDLQFLRLEGREDEVSKAAVALKHGRITELELDRLVATSQHAEGIEREIALLTVEYEHCRLTKHEYEKQVATLREEPWVGVINDGFNPDDGINGYFFEFDWNELWIEFLRLNGYVGESDEDIHAAWFNDICRTPGVGDLRRGDEIGPLLP